MTPNYPEPTKTYKVLILGASGLFGSRLAHLLATSDLPIHLVLAARTWSNLKTLKDTLASHPDCRAPIDILKLDMNDEKTLVHNHLSINRPDILVNTSGPYQAMSLDLVSICVELNINYFDLCDHSDYCNQVVAKFHTRAQSKNISLITAASSVPSLSSAMVYKLLPQFKSVEQINMGITPGNHTPRGFATVHSILSYVGKPFRSKINGQSKTIYGWQDLSTRTYPILGKRYLSNCDVPDLTLLPRYLPHIKTIRFQAGLELPILHLGLWSLSILPRYLPLNLCLFTNSFIKVSQWFIKKGTSHGAMHVELTGQLNTKGMGRQVSRCIYIIAQNNSGPFIPVLAPFILIKQLICKQLPPGAQIAFNLIDLSQFEAEFTRLGIKIIYR